MTRYKNLYIVHRLMLEDSYMLVNRLAEQNEKGLFYFTEVARLRRNEKCRGNRTRLISLIGDLVSRLFF